MTTSTHSAPTPEHLQSIAMEIGRKLGYRYVTIGPDRHTWIKPDGTHLNIVHYLTDQHSSNDPILDAEIQVTMTQAFGSPDHNDPDYDDSDEPPK